MKEIKLYRRRYIPDELVYLKDDEIVSADEHRVITRWRVLKPRKDFSHGASCYFIDEGIKVSKFLNDEGKIVYWYCDIIDTEISSDRKTYTFNDLLIDVIVYENGFVKVMDLAETGEALRRGLIGTELMIKAAERAGHLLDVIYKGSFEEYIKYIKEV